MRITCTVLVKPSRSAIQLTLIEDMVQAGRRIIARSTRVVDPASSSEMQRWPGAMELHVCDEFQNNIIVDPCTIYTQPPVAKCRQVDLGMYRASRSIFATPRDP